MAHELDHALLSDAYEARTAFSARAAPFSMGPRGVADLNVNGRRHVWEKAMTQTFVNDGDLGRRVDARSITASPWAFVITPGAAQLINTSHRVLLTPRSADKPGGRVEGVLPHVVDPQTLSLHLPSGVVRELARRPNRVCEGVLAISFGLSSELVLRGTVVATTPISEPGAKAAENPGFLRVAFRVTFLAIVTETGAKRDLAGREAGRTISLLNQLEMEGVLARCSQ